MLTIAHLSDSHLGAHSTAHRTRSCWPGDLADHGLPGLVSTVTLDAEPLPEFTSEVPPMFAVHFMDDDLEVLTHWRALSGLSS